jgi:chromosome segregation ATPase
MWVAVDTPCLVWFVLTDAQYPGMNLNPIKWLNWLITEHGSATILRDHNALLQSQKSALAAEIATLKSEIESLKNERDFNKSKSEDLQTQRDVLQKEVEKLNSVRVSLKDQTQLQNRIRQLEAINADVERQLRIKSIGGF